MCVSECLGVCVTGSGEVALVLGIFGSLGTSHTVS